VGPHAREWTIVLVRCIAFLAAAGIAVGFLGPSAARAATLTVINTLDSGPGSLRDAVAQAQPGDTIDFPPAFAGFAILLTSGEIVIDKDLVIAGPRPTVVSGYQRSRVFNVRRGATVSISGLSVSEGLSAGEGGGIYNEGKLTLTNSTVGGNQTLSLVPGNDVFCPGVGRNGGGIYNAGELVLIDSFVSQNKAGNLSPFCAAGLGGGIYNQPGATLTITGSSINDNLSGPGGGIYNAATIDEIGIVTITNSAIRSNRATQGTSQFGGGGIYNAGAMVLRNSVVHGNQTNLYLDGNISCSVVGRYGGGIYNGGDLDVFASTLSGNSSSGPCGSPHGGGGGGIYNDPEGIVTVSTSTISGNSADVGGGIYNDSNVEEDGSAVISNSTISSNFAFIGGGLANFNEGHISLANTTITGNGSLNGPSGIAGDVAANNTIVAGNSGTADLGGTLSGTGNIVGTMAGLILGPLADNGGPTATHALLAGSVAAIGQGNLATCMAAPVAGVDQRGQARGPAACSVGAYELPLNNAVLLSTSASPVNAGAAVVFTAMVAGASPTGTVRFKDGGATILGCGAVALAGSGNVKAAVCSSSALAVGVHSITATYRGDAANASSTSNTVSQVILQVPKNVALASAGGVATASSTFSAGFPASAVNDNERKGVNWSNGGGWRDATPDRYPDWVEIKFNGIKTIDRVVVYTIQDDNRHPVEPTDDMTFSKDGIKDFSVQGWNGSTWVVLASVTDNQWVKRSFSFSAFTTDRVRVRVTRALTSYSRIIEVEAWTAVQTNLPATTTLLTGSLPVVAGTSVRLTATVTGSSPTGNVAFIENNVVLPGCDGVALTGPGDVRAATCSISSLTAGTHGITARYIGDARNGPSTSNTVVQVVNAPSGGSNVALATAGAVASASSTSGAAYPVTAVNDNERKGVNWTNGGGWRDGTPRFFPDWVQINFAGAKTIERVVVYTIQDDDRNPIEPTDSTTFDQDGIRDFSVQGWKNNAWVTLATVSNNNLVKRSVTFAPFKTDRIRVNVTKALNLYSRIVEIEAWGQ
jgi:hypothetical protein